MTPQELTAAATGGGALDFFELLGLPRRYHIDHDTLDAHYLERSKRVHPDRFVNADAKQRVAALQQSMNLNNAYKTLRKPIARAEYLLERAGVVIGANEAVAPSLLIEVLELREELADAKQSRDTALLARLADQMHDRRDAALARVGALFGGDAAWSDDADTVAEIKTQLVLLRYINRYLDEFDQDEAV
jgi:molecular chaperone HscB